MGCTPDELLEKLNSRQVAEIMAYFRLENEDMERDRKRAGTK